MRRLFNYTLIVVAVTTALLSISSCHSDQEEEIVSVYLTYTINSDNGEAMPGTKSSNSEVFDEFYQKIKSGDLVAQGYSLTFIEKNTGASYTVNGTWAGKDMVTLRTGSYRVKGTSTAVGDNIQERCSLKFDDEIWVDINSNTITLNASYDCALIIFSDESLAKLSNYNGSKSADLFKFSKYIYAFIHTTLYEEGKQDHSYLEGRHTNDSYFRIYTGHLSYEIGKYYVYNDINSSFDLEKMEEGGPEGFPVDLSKPGTANCYIVSYPGSFKFRADVMGNSEDLIEGAPTKAEVLWESYGTGTAPSVGDIIPYAAYNEGYIYFNTPNSLAEGNALIVLRDASNTILWSWHIWVSEGFNPAKTQQIYGNNAGIMMDRNLGALTNEKGNMKSYGLHYQWGRKDPFTGKALSISSSLSTIPSIVSKSSTTGLIAYTVTHPYEIISGGVEDWSNTTDEKRWDDAKTKYDPCPYGWRVPSGDSNGVWAVASGNLSQFPMWHDTSLYGIDCSEVFSCANVWYPCAGYRDAADGVYNGEGDDVNVWSCNSINANYAYFFDYNIPGSPNLVLTYAGNNRTGSKSYSRNVRCQKVNM